MVIHHVNDDYRTAIAVGCEFEDEPKLLVEADRGGPGSVAFQLFEMQRSQGPQVAFILGIDQDRDFLAVCLNDVRAPLFRGIRCVLGHESKLVVVEEDARQVPFVQFASAVPIGGDLSVSTHVGHITLRMKDNMRVLAVEQGQGPKERQFEG